MKQHSRICASRATITDFGTDSTAPVDYPDSRPPSVAQGRRRTRRARARRLRQRRAAAIAAIKLRGVRAGLATTPTGRAGVLHDDANVLVLGARDWPWPPKPCHRLSTRASPRRAARAPLQKVHALKSRKAPRDEWYLHAIAELLRGELAAAGRVDASNNTARLWKKDACSDAPTR
jgi:hypothetical protein